MRDRRPEDWQHDLAGRHPLEDHVADALRRHSRLALIRRSTENFDRLDFQVLGAGERLVELELKAKNQPLSSDWCRLRPELAEQDLFVLDELAIRKIVDGGRNAFMLVRDRPSRRWLLWSSGDLAVATRVRCARRLHRSAVAVMKGKLLLDLSEAGFASETLPAALDAMADVMERLDSLWSDVAPWPSSVSVSR